MAEYAGKGTSVFLEDDAIILKYQDKNEHVRESLARRIPLAAIRDVIFKDASIGEGFIWLVLGATPPPGKASVRKAGLGNQDAVVFRSGAQAKAMRELHDYLMAAVARHREQGVDPASVPYDLPWSDDELISRYNGRKVPSLGLRADLQSAAAALSDYPKAIRSSLSALSDELGPDETVEALTAGGYGSVVANVGAILAVTTRRVVVATPTGVVESATIPRGLVSGVTWQQGVLGGRLDVSGGGRSFALQAVDKVATTQIVNILDQRPEPVAAPSVDVLERLERLVALRDAGALTFEEFEQQKARVLADDA